MVKATDGDALQAHAALDGISGQTKRHIQVGGVEFMTCAA